MNTNLIRSIEKKDYTSVLKIYNYYINNSTYNFEEKRSSLKDFNLFVKYILSKQLPFIVYQSKNIIIGFAFLQPFRSKSGYRFTFENSIYVHPKFINQGIGNILLKNLIKSSKKNNLIKSIIAVIGDSKNYNLIKNHYKNGFKKIGILKSVGFKKNKWIDSVYMQKIL